jgi:perosamine synthetase
MLTAISRYGPRVLPDTEQIIAACHRRGELVQGAQIAEFEDGMARHMGSGRAVSASYGRMAYFYILKALKLPPDSEVILPALTFWVIPELTRVAGFKPVFADVDPATFNLAPDSVERLITSRTRAIVPTHLYGRPCDMDAILRIADRHNLTVIEDCAHALGARYRGRLAGTFGNAAFFSFQTLKPLNTYGGGLALLHDAELAQRVADMASAEPWPTEASVLHRLRSGRAQRVLTRPRVFTYTLFPILWLASWFKARPDVYLWEKIRRLDPLPPSYRERYSNVQAALGLAGLRHLEEWTSQTRAHARRIEEALANLPGVVVPATPPEILHAYYQYCFYAPDRDAFVRRCIRHGIDVETLHVDVCSQLPLFEDACRALPGAERAAQAVQFPIYAGLEDDQVESLALRVRELLSRGAKRCLALSEAPKS